MPLGFFLFYPVCKAVPRYHDFHFALLVALVFPRYNDRSSFPISLTTFKEEFHMAKAAAKTETKKPLSKSEIITNLVETTGLAKKDVVAIFDALTDEIKKSFDKKGAKVFVLPGLLKIDLKQVKAQPAKKNVKNPLTGELYNRPAKPAHKKIRVRALKALKDIV